jgi:hypothetical protein
VPYSFFTPSTGVCRGSEFGRSPPAQNSARPAPQLAVGAFEARGWASLTRSGFCFSRLALGRAVGCTAVGSAAAEPTPGRQLTGKRWLMSPAAGRRNPMKPVHGAAR